MDLYTLLIIGHIIGTVLGVGGATFIEIHLNVALADGTMDQKERRYMWFDFITTRLGMGLLFLTGAGFVALYISNNQIHRLYDGVFLAKMSIVALLIFNAFLLHKHKIGLYWGSALSFVSWWAAMILGTFLTNNVRFFHGNNLYAYGATMGVYAVSVVIGAMVLHRIRQVAKTAVGTPPQTPQQPT